MLTLTMNYQKFFAKLSFEIVKLFLDRQIGAVV